jgi:hypothetical protein
MPRKAKCPFSSVLSDWYASGRPSFPELGTLTTYRAAEFVKKYEGKGQKVDLEEGGKKSVFLKVSTEEDE